MTLLAVAGLSKDFGGIHAVEDVSFTLAAGAIHAIIGPNGAGKTTLLNLLSGFCLPSRGRIRLEGCDIAGKAPPALAALGISRTFQTPQVFFDMSAVENVMVGQHRHLRCGLLAALLRLPGMARRDRACRARCADLLDVVGLAGHADVPADAMPYGALKRLEIARALATRPRLLLLDEPAAGLNPTESGEIAALIRRVAASGITVVLVEHDMKMVMGISDHVVVLNHGRMLAEGTPAQVCADPRVVTAYLGGQG